MDFFQDSKAYHGTTAQAAVLKTARDWKRNPVPFRLERYAQLLLERGQLLKLERLLINPEYIYRAALAMPGRRDYFRLQVMALRRRRKFSAETQFQLIMANRFFESIVVTALPSRASDTWYGDFAWQARGLDFHQKFLVMLVVYCKKVEKGEKDTTLKYRLTGYLQGQGRVGNIQFQEEYSERRDPEKAQIRASDFKDVVRWSMARLAQEPKMLNLLIRFIGFPEAIAWIASMKFASSVAIRSILEAAGHQKLPDFIKADTRYRTSDWDKINVESLVSLVKVLVLYHRLGLGSLIITDENLAYFESEVARAYHGEDKTIAWPYRRRQLGDDVRVIVRCAVTDPLIEAESPELMEILLPRICSACPGTGEQRHQVAVHSLFENSLGREGGLEAAFMELKKTPLWGEIISPLWLLQNICFIEGLRLSFEHARNFIELTPRQFFRHRVAWAIELTVRQLSSLWGRVSEWRQSEDRLNPRSLRDSALHYLQGRPEALAFFLAQANQTVSKRGVETIEIYRAELLRLQSWIHAMPDPKLRRFICNHFKVEEFFRKPPATPRLATLRTLLLVRRYFISKFAATNLDFPRFLGLEYSFFYDRPNLLEWLWPGTFAYYINDLAAYLAKKKSPGIRLWGTHYACWVWRVSFYLADRLALSRRSYEDFVGTRFEAEFHAGTGAQSQYLPRDSVPGYDAIKSGRPWLRSASALLILIFLSTYAGFLWTSKSYVLRDAFKIAPFLSFLRESRDRVGTLRVEPSLVLSAIRAGLRHIGQGVLEGGSTFPWSWAESSSRRALEKLGIFLGSLVLYITSSWVVGHLCIWLAQFIPLTAKEAEDREQYISVAVSLVVGVIGIVWLVFLCMRLL